MFIYLVRLDGEPVYVGLTTGSVARRWADHQYLANTTVGTHRAMANALRKYPAERFTVEQIAEASSLEELNALEVELIAKWGTLAPGGYNLTAGGGGQVGRVASEETKKKLSVAAKGRKHTPEACAKVSAANKGKPKPEGFGARVGATQKGKYVSDETRAKQSKAHETRTVYTTHTEAERAAISERTTTLWAGRTEDERLAITSKAWDTRRANGTDGCGMTPEACKARGQKARATRLANKAKKLSEQATPSNDNGCEPTADLDKAGKTG